MKKSDLIREITSTYQKHGWELKNALLRAETRREVSSDLESILGEARIQEGAIDALWFSRPSHSGGGAWELRLVAETPYALFERIEAEETDEKRTRIFRNMEDLLCQYAKGR